MNYKYQDLLIKNGDLVLDSGGNPLLIQDIAVIAQDIKHAMIESGLAIELIGEKSSTKIADIKIKMELLVEEETRLISGTVSITEPKIGMILITAITRDFGEFSLEIKR